MALGDCFMTKGCQDTSGMLLFGQASSGVTEDTDIGVGADDEVRLVGAALAVFYCFSDLVADIEAC